VNLLKGSSYLCSFHDSKHLKFVAEDTNSAAVLGSFKILSYNVWFREDLEMHRRMKALGELIQVHSPDVICLQVFLVPYLMKLDLPVLTFILTISIFPCRRLFQIYMTYFSDPAGGKLINALFLLK